MVNITETNLDTANEISTNNTIDADEDNEENEDNDNDNNGTNSCT